MKRFFSVAIVLAMALSFAFNAVAGEFKEVTVTRENGRWGYTGLAIILGVSVPNFVEWNPQIREMENPNLIRPGMKFRYIPYDSASLTEEIINERVRLLESTMESLVIDSEQGLRKDIADLDKRISEKLKEMAANNSALDFQSIVSKLEKRVDEVANELAASEERTATRIATSALEVAKEIAESEERTANRIATDVLEISVRLDQVDKEIAELKEIVNRPMAPADLKITAVDGVKTKSAEKSLLENIDKSVRDLGALLTGVKAESQKNGMLLGLAVIILILVIIALVAMAIVRLLRPRPRQKAVQIVPEVQTEKPEEKPGNQFTTEPFEINGVRYVYTPRVINGRDDGKLIVAVPYNTSKSGEFTVGYRSVLAENSRRSVKSNFKADPRLVEREIKKGRLKKL